MKTSVLPRDRSVVLARATASVRASLPLEALESRRLLTTITATAPFHGQQSVAVGANITVTFGKAMTASTLTASTIQLRDSANNLLTTSLSYNSTSRVLTIDPSANLISNSNYYRVTVVGGSSGVRATDNTTLASTYNFEFTAGTPNFSEQTVFSGLYQPVNVEFAPNGRIYVAEKSGLVKMFDSLTDTTADTVIDLRVNTHNYWDRGMLGMTLDPQFNSGRPFLYVLYVYDGLIGGPAPRNGTNNNADDSAVDPLGNGALASGRLSRFTIGADGRPVGGEQVLIHDWVQQFPSHAIGDVKFGPDGFLYASAGDGASFNFVDWGQNGNPFNDPAQEGGALRSLDILSSGDPTGLDGTIIRVNPDTGLGAPGNPFANSSDINNRRIIAYGLRNPFRIQFKPGTSELYIADTGWGAFEEINVIPNASSGSSLNFGWPAYEGPARQSGYDGANLPLIESLYANPSAHSTPWLAYRHNEQVVPGSTEPTGGSSPTGIAFYGAGTYPGAYAGSMFWSDYSRGRTYVNFVGPDGQLSPTNRVLFPSTRKVVELERGPDGNIYFVDMQQGAVRRWVATGYNRAPTAVVSADRTNGPSPLTVRFDGRASSDPDLGDTLSYSWDLNGDNIFGDSSLAQPQFTYTTPGTFTARLRVTDPAGATDTASIDINVGNNAPVPTITSPLTTLRWQVDQTISFAGSATDVEDGTLAASRLQWNLVLVHGNEIDPTNTHEHPITSFTGTSGSFVAPDHEWPSWIELRLTATDSRGLSTTVTRRLDPQTSTLNFATNPPGLRIAINGTDFVTPFSRTVIVGSSNTISAVTPQNLGATTYLFGSWSHAQPATHALTAPAATTTYTATYNASTLQRLTGTVIGTTGSFNNSGNTRERVFDDDTATFFDAPVGNGAWAGLDLGSTRTIQQLRFFPRDGWTPRMVGGRFQASNSATFSSGVVDLHVVGGEPTNNQWVNVLVNGTTPYRYVRYLSPNDGWANIAEVEFYTAVISDPPVAPSFLTGWFASPGVQLFWNDESSNETGFKIERRLGTGSFAEIGTVGAGVREFFDTTIVGGNSYGYRVRAFNASANSPYTDIVTIATQPVIPTAPAAPTALTATPVSATLIRLTWADNSNSETDFRIDRRLPGGVFTQLGLVGSNVTVFDDPTAAASTTYEYRVLATNAGGTSDPSNTASATTPAPSGAPAAPSALSAGVNSDRSVTLNWTDNANNESGFQIERRFTGWIWEAAGTVTANVRTFTDSATLGDAQYEYRVRAVNGSVGSGWSNVVGVNTAVVGQQPPLAPSSLAASPNSSTRIDLSWQDNSGDEIGFRVERRLPGGSWAQIGTTSANVNTYADSTVVAGTTYEYRVRAAGNGSTFSTYSNATSATTPGGTGIPAAPSGLTASWRGNPNRVVLNWLDNSSNENAFRIERRFAGWIWESIDTVAANIRTFTDSSAIAGVVYEYRIVAIGGGGPSSPSNTVLVDTTVAPV